MRARPAGVAITLLGTILFSTKAVIVKLAFAGTAVDAVTLLALRMLFALPFYLAVAVYLQRGSGGAPLSRRQWIAVLGLGLLGYYLSSLFDFLGLQYISAGLERLILFLYPTFAVLINRFAFGQKLDRRQTAALALTYAGIGTAFFGELGAVGGSPQFFLGALLVLLCALTYAGYIVGSGRVIPGVGAGRFTAYAMLAATGGVLAHFAVARGGGGLEGTAALWPYGLGLAVVATVLPSFLLSEGLKRIGSNQVAVVSTLGPVSTILQARIFLGEPFGVVQAAGSALVIAGVLLISWRA